MENAGRSADRGVCSLPRRQLVAGGAACAMLRPALGATCNVPTDQKLTFQVSRNGSPIGVHCVAFSRSGAMLTAQINAAFKVGFGLITFYRYQHSGTEIWHGDQFQSLQTTTNDNGTLFHVQAERSVGGIHISSSGKPDRIVSGNALPLTHWAIAAMTAPLFNPQTGETLRETVRTVGQANVMLASGRTIPATGYALAGEAPIKDWFDEAGVWAALDAIGKDNSLISYRRI